MNNTIAIRVFDFLKNYPPFTMVEKQRLLKVAEKIVIQYYESQQYIFNQDDPTADYFYVIKEGGVQLLRTEVDNKILVDECDAGDVFGIRPLLAKRPYVVSAQAMEETLIYAIHTDDFQDIFKNNSDVAFYLASNFAAGVAINLQKKERVDFITAPIVKSPQIINSLRFNLSKIVKSQLPVLPKR